jgi:PAS domain S-box-containing protein
MAMIMDVTERRSALDRLAANERRYRTMIESATDLVVVIGNDGMVRYVSPSVDRILGHQPADLIGNNAFELIHPDDAQGTLEEIARVMAGGSGLDSYRARIRAADSSFRMMEGNSMNLLEDPSVQGILFHMRDVTERDRAEREVRLALEAEREAADRLRALDELKGSFLTAVSHELRTPLAAVLGSALTLENLEWQLRPEDRGQLTHAVVTGAKKLNRLLTDLLDLDRLGRGIIEPVRGETDVAALVRRCIEENSAALANHDIQLDLDAVTASVDSSKVERIVENLLTNAARHTPAGSAVRVELRGTTDGGVSIVVADEGDGVPEEYKATVFEPFQRAGHNLSHAPGLGIGLSIVAKFAELHGGRAWVEDRPGGGASFRVVLPGGPPEGAGLDGDTGLLTLIASA